MKFWRVLSLLVSLICTAIVSLFFVFPIRLLAAAGLAIVKEIVILAGSFTGIYNNILDTCFSEKEGKTEDD